MDSGAQEGFTAGRMRSQCRPCPAFPGRLGLRSLAWVLCLSLVRGSMGLWASPITPTAVGKNQILKRKRGCHQEESPQNLGSWESGGAYLAVNSRIPIPCLKNFMCRPLTPPKPSSSPAVSHRTHTSGFSHSGQSSSSCPAYQCLRPTLAHPKSH